MTDPEPNPPPEVTVPSPETAAVEPKKRGGFWRVVLLIVLVAIFAYDVQQQLNEPLQLKRTTNFDLSPGSGFNTSLGRLADTHAFGSMRQRYYLLAYARYNGLTTSIKAGEYALDPGLTPLGLLTLWEVGRTVPHEVRLIEGWRWSQALDAIRRNPDLVQTIGEADPAAVAKSIGLDDGVPEGQLFPDTYRFSKGTTDVVVLKNARVAMNRILEAEWTQRAADLPYVTPNQALIMASIVEKETGRSSERSQIAGVFVRRLRLGMRLQTDPSVIYGMGDSYEGSIHVTDLQRDTPYNSYTRDGLPPTPICLPGRDAIHAALHPDDGDALYFVSRGDGSHQFSATLDEHNEAVRKYQLRPGATR